MSLDTDYVGSVGPKVFVMGDSIAFQSRDAIHAQMGDVNQVRVAGFVGATWEAYGRPCTQCTPALPDSFTRAAESNPDVFVAILGTNDSGAFVDAEIESHMQFGLSKLPQACHVLVMPALAPTVPFTPPSPALQGIIRAHADVVVEWGAEVALYPELVGPDGVHPGAPGQIRLAELIEAALEGC